MHGAFEDVYVWAGVSARLQARGYRIVAINLPGRPSARSPVKDATSDAYRDTVLQAIHPEPGPVVLVGHGFGGFAVSAVAEAVPDKVQTAVFLSAYLPQDGDSMFSLMKRDCDSQLNAALEFLDTQDVLAVKHSLRAELFANGAPEGMRDLLPDIIVDEPVLPIITPVKLTAAGFGQVDKVYIHTTQDRIVSPYLQEDMVQRTPVRLRVRLDTGHASCLTEVAGLARAIEDALG